MNSESRRENGRSFFDQPISGWPRRRVIWSCDASKGPLLTRYFLLQTPWFAIYLHHLQASDEDRALHDHPWSFITFLLSSGYFEWTPGAQVPAGERYAAVGRADGWWFVVDREIPDGQHGHVVANYHPGVPAEVFAESHAKRLNTDLGGVTPAPVRAWRRRFSILWRPAEWQHRLELVKPTWTLVLRLRRRREWGFITKNGWLDWRSYGKAWCD